jgi:hypothetical protein
VLGEEVHGAHGVVGIDEREDSHPLLVDPAPSRVGIGEVGSGYGEPWLEAQGGKDLEGFSGLVRLQIDDQIDIGGEASVAVEYGGETADDHVADLGLVEGGEERLEQGHSRSIGRHERLPGAWAGRNVITKRSR